MHMHGVLADTERYTVAERYRDVTMAHIATELDKVMASVGLDLRTVDLEPSF